MNLDGYTAAWAAYLCATLGHAFVWSSAHTGGPPPQGCICQRCGARHA